MTSGVAGRYASALFELAKEQKAVPAVMQGLSGLAKAISESPDLRRLLGSPVFKSEDQMAAIEGLSAKGKFSGLALNFVKLMCKNRRLPALSETIAAFQALVAEDKGEAVAEVVSAEKLSAAQLKDLSAALKARVGKDVQLLTKVDSSILGGLTVKIGSTLIDNSLKTKLSNLKTAMKGSA